MLQCTKRDTNTIWNREFVRDAIRLRHYGNVKDPMVENLLPDFDFDHTVGRRLASTGGTRSVVLMVVDATNFDGSFLRKVARLVSETIEENSEALK